jgi:multidrug efflux pump subunit AcrA (membrane-fusion protein)
MKKPYLRLALILVAVLGAFAIVRGVRARASSDEARQGTASLTVARGAFLNTLRMTGLVESIHFHNVAAPRLVGTTGPGSNTLVVTKLLPSGTHVEPGQFLVEFDRQNQLKAAIDKRSEYLDLEEQIRKKRAEQEQARAKDETELAVAANAVQNAQIEMRKNPYLGRIDQEKNEQRLEESQAKQTQLKETFDLKRRAEQADLRILEIQRDRAQHAMTSSEDNATRMVVTSPISGMVVLRMVWRAGQQLEIQEGEEARPGMPILQVVDPASMLVRVKVNQADVHDPARRSTGADLARCLSRTSIRRPGRAGRTRWHDEPVDDTGTQLRRDCQHRGEPPEAAPRSVSSRGRRARSEGQRHRCPARRDRARERLVLGAGA